MNKFQVFLCSVCSYSAWGRGRVITTLPIQIWANSQFEILGDRRCKMGPKSFWIWICFNNFYKYNFSKLDHKTLEANYLKFQSNANWIVKEFRQIWINYIISFDKFRQKYSRLTCLLHVKGLVVCFYLGWSGSILQFRQNIIKVGSKLWLLTCSSNITLSLPSYTGSALKRELNFVTAILVCCILGYQCLPQKISWV